MNAPLALLTGAAGGIGCATLTRLLDRGYTVLCVERDAELAARAASRPGTEPVVCDLSDPAAVERLATRIRTGWADRLEVVVLNAGVLVIGAAVDTTAAQRRLQLEVMLCSAVELATAAAEVMRPRGRGHVVAVVSAGGILALPGSAVYSAAKGGLRLFLTALRTELRGSGVRVSGVYPSAVDTPMLEHEARHGGSLLNFVGALSTPDDVAAGVLRALDRGRLEVFVPYSDSVPARLLALAPWTVPRLVRFASVVGRRRRDRYLAVRDAGRPG
ncbi:SDR family NAD(P)-dependent oxidoreductase [Pseudonocardia alni]|uniref:SDR family NAD(P)-dependent oxidoreductase n=1 Tax=Pseudonocardia alni TaxID=33907 RepID=UPI0033FF3340